MDFDNGLPSSTVWTQATAGSGTLMLSKAAADSAPNSMATVVGAGNDTATIAWSDVGATPVKSVTVTAAVNYTPQFGNYSSGQGYVTLLSISTGSDETWIYYTVNGTDSSGNTGFTGISAYSGYAAGEVLQCPCAIGVASLNANVWNTISMVVNPVPPPSSQLGSIQISINGTSSTCNCKFAQDTAVKVIVGPDEGSDTSNPSAYGWKGYYDNITVAVQR